MFHVRKYNTCICNVSYSSSASKSVGPKPHLGLLSTEYAPTPELKQMHSEKYRNKIPKNMLDIGDQACKTVFK